MPLKFVDTLNAMVSEALLGNRAPWPDWANVIAAQKNETENGVGDTAERVVGLVGSNEFRNWYRLHVGDGRPPRCCAALNNRFPYNKK